VFPARHLVPGLGKIVVCRPLPHGPESSLPTTALHSVRRSAAFVPGTGGYLACSWPSNGGDVVCVRPPYSDQACFMFGSVGGGATSSRSPHSHFAAGMGLVAVASVSGRIGFFGK
jgi:hypothetical protein